MISSGKLTLPFWPKCPVCRSRVTWASLLWKDDEWFEKWTCGKHVWLVQQKDGAIVCVEHIA